MKPKILFFDIETAPNKAYTWGLWKELKSTDMIASNWYILCWAAKWLGSKEVISAGMYSAGEDDKKVMQKLWTVLDEADIIVAHNAVKFDCKKANTRFIAHGMPPPSPSLVIDTLKVARNKFAFTSNRLNDLSKFFNLGQKSSTGGFELWTKCMEGDLKAWSKMVRYCKHDVTLLEKVYLKLRPYMSKHPNISVIKDKPVCPKCGSSKIHYRGYAITCARKYKRFQCRACGGWGRGTTSVLDNKAVGSL